MGDGELMKLPGDVNIANLGQMEASIHCETSRVEAALRNQLIHPGFVIINRVLTLPLGY